MNDTVRKCSVLDQLNTSARVLVTCAYKGKFEIFSSVSNPHHNTDTWTTYLF